MVLKRSQDRLKPPLGRVLDNLRIVLVEPSHPGNIGAAARAMKTMSLHSLYLVKPRFFPHADATARASGADDVLASAVCCDSLEEALMDCAQAYACSARQRSLRWPQLSPRKCAEMMISKGINTRQALVFGREQWGLSNIELDLCHYLVYIPCNPAYRSLNLAAAVQILCYELFVASSDDSQVQLLDDMSRIKDSIAEVELVERFYDHLEETLITLEFLDTSNPKHLMRRLRRLFNRVKLTHKEVNILRGILTATQRKTSSHS